MVVGLAPSYSWQGSRRMGSWFVLTEGRRTDVYHQRRLPFFKKMPLVLLHRTSSAANISPINVAESSKQVSPRHLVSMVLIADVTMRLSQEVFQTSAAEADQPSCVEERGKDKV